MAGLIPPLFWMATQSRLTRQHSRVIVTPLKPSTVILLIVAVGNRRS